MSIVGNEIIFSAKAWRYPGAAGWYFVSLSKKDTSTIRKFFGVLSRGWGSLRVRAGIRDTIWETSIFYDSKSSTYMLPLKKEVRIKENILEHTSIQVRLIVVTD